MAAANGDVALAMQQALLKDVDAKVAEKVEELWQKGKQMLSQVQQKHQEKAEKLGEEVSRCLERQRALEAENEQLKQLVSDMTNRISVLCGTVRQPTAGCALAATSAGHNSAASTSPVPRSDPAEVFTPVRGSGSTCEVQPPLPEVPPFPFPPSQPAVGAGSTTQAAPLLLSEALGTSSPEKFADTDLQQTPALLSLASSLPQSPEDGQQTPTLLSLASSLPPQSACVEAYGGGNPMVFSFTIRKADETDLGLNVTQREQERVLCVEGVRAEGAVDAWNRQCLGGAYPERVVVPGDMIISVNSIQYDPDRMLEECKERQLLRLTIARGGLPYDALQQQQSPSTGALGVSPTDCTAATATATATAPATSATGAAASPGATSLRAEASEFVPRAAAAAEATPKDAASPAVV